MLSSALIEQAKELCDTAEKYLKETLDPAKCGYPNLYFSAEGLTNAQVTTNVVESWHKKIANCLNDERLNLAQFVNNIVMIQNLHEGPHFVNWPMRNQQTGYTMSMKGTGTWLVNSG